MKNTETLTDASKEVGLEVNTEKTKYIATDLINALPGNNSVNTFQQATIEEAVFLCQR
jgi:hypothetical protein